jgi:N-methylhydantoinase A
VNQYEFFIPKVDIQAIGAGGGSLVRVDPTARSLRVGPQSAGAVPGPICYKRGGTIPTVTDAALVLGYLDPDNFAGGRMRLDRAAAAAGIQAIADQLGLGLFECASGITKIVEFGMADIIRRSTVGKGYDPRDFVLFAFGGAGPVHAGVFARELGVQKVIIPQRETASTWCAFGAASADVLHIHERVDIMVSPFERPRFENNIVRLRDIARKELEHDGLSEDRQRLYFAVDMRHKGQINEVEVLLDWDRDASPFDETLAARFYERYEQLYGKGSSFRGARLEMVTFRVRATAEMPRPTLRSSEHGSGSIESAHRAARPIYWDESREVVQTPIYDGSMLRQNQWVHGPAVIETPDTSVVVRPGQSLALDKYGNFELIFSKLGESDVTVEGPK